MNNKQDFFKTDFYHIIFQVNKMAGHVPKKTMIVVRPTGVGKSTFCNVIEEEILQIKTFSPLVLVVNHVQIKHQALK